MNNDSYLRLLLDSTAAAFYAVDTEGITTHCNTAFIKILGFKDSGEVIGRKLHDVIHHSHPDGSHYPLEKCPIYKVAKGGDAVHIESEFFYCIDGTNIPVEYWAYPIVKNNEHLGAICTFIDISERRQSEAALRESEQRFRFLSQLDEATRGLEDSSQVMEVTTRLLGEYMQVSRCAYADVDEDNDGFTIRNDYCAPGNASTVGTYSLNLFGSRAAAKLRAGRTLIIRDIAAELAPEDGAEMFKSIGINAIICCPLVKDGQLKAMMAVHQAGLHDWSNNEVKLVETIVERCWAHIERIRSQEELRESEQRVRLIVNTALDAVIMTDAAGVVTEWNQQAEAIFGWTHQEAVGAQMSEMIIPPEHKNAHQTGMERFLKTGETRILNKRVEITALTKQGKVFPIELAVTAQKYKGQTYFTAFARDITERTHSEEKLRESEEQFRQLANSIPQLAWMTDESGWIHWYNQRWYDFTGTDLEEMQGWGWHAVHHPDYVEAVTERFKQAVEMGLAWEDTFPIRSKTGEYRWFLSRAFPIQDTKGHVVRWFGTNTDITDQLEAAKALYESQERTRLTVDSIKDYAIISMDIKGIITSWNQGAKAIFDFAADEIIGAPFSTLFTPEDRQNNADVNEIMIATRTGRAVDERWHMRKDGQRFFASGILSAVKDDEGKLLGFTKIARDVTTRKEAEEMLIQARNAAEAANIAKSEFLANMSHEIRTPMNAVIGLSNILAMSQPLTPKQKEFIKTLQLSADSLLSLINDLLDISKIEARTVELEHIPFSMTQLIQETISMMSTRAQEKNLTFTMEGECINNKMFIGDPTRLRQIVMNLCSNAVKFTQRGSIDIAITCHPTSDPHSEDICIEVKDSGIGIAPDKLATIFEKFVQADNSINRKYGGTGLGLAITKTLTEIMGGTIKVESVLGKGSNFMVCIKLPLAAQGMENAYAHGVHIAPQDQQDKFQSMVLVVEDYAPNVMVVSTFLEQFGYTTDVAGDGKVAFEKVKNGNFAAVLMDVQMPGMNGFEATQMIREHERQMGLPRLPIIGMTAHALSGDRERCISVGMDDYISKPFNPEELKDKLAMLTK